MAANLVRRCSRPLAATTRQFTVGATLSASKTSASKTPVEDPVKKLFLDKIKVASYDTS